MPGVEDGNAGKAPARFMLVGGNALVGIVFHPREIGLP